MKPQRSIFNWFAMSIIFAVIFQFVPVSPSVSAQGVDTLTPAATLTVTDINQDGLDDNQLSLLSPSARSTMLLNQQASAFSIGMIATGDYQYPRDRLISLGYSVSIIPPTSGLSTFQQYDIVYLPQGWAQVSNGSYEILEARANDYRSYVYQGGSLFSDQPNPYEQPDNTVTPSLFPYPITFYNEYTFADYPPVIVDPSHFITNGLTGNDMPVPADQMINIDPFYHTLVVGRTTGSASLVVGEYGAGRILVQTAHPARSAFRPFSDTVYIRMIEWIGSSSVYDCSGTTLSPVAQAVFGEVDYQEFCGNHYDRFITLPPGQQAFQRFSVLAQEARYEIDFTTMIWDDKGNSQGDNPGRIFLQGVQTLYDKVQRPFLYGLPFDYFSEGVTVRILIGKQKYELNGNIDQRIYVMHDLQYLGIPLNDPILKWKVEVAYYNVPEPRTHSHVKLMIVDGKKVIVGGYNMQNINLNPDILEDRGVEVSGPIALDSMRVFDGLWMGAHRCDDYSCSQETTITNISRSGAFYQALSNPTPTGDDIVFSLFRDRNLKTSDNAIETAINAASGTVNIYQNRFMDDLLFHPPQYARAILDVLQKNGPQVRVKLLVTGWPFPPEDAYLNMVGICMLRFQLWREDPSKLPYLQTRLSNGSNPIHAKALSIDNSFLIVGSQNFDYSAWGDDASLLSFGDLAEYNLAINSESATTAFNTDFDVKWNTSHTLDCMNSGMSASDLQDTINQALPNSSLFIPAGTYTGSITIDKPLVLVGAGANQTIIQPEGSEPAFRITSSNVEITNMKISGGEGYGIELIDSSPSSLRNIQINRVVFENNTQGGVLAQGLIAGSPMNYTIENSTFIGGMDGITINMLEMQADASIVRNNIFSGQSVAPIHILSSDDSHVEYSYNLFDDCGAGNCAANWHLGNLGAASSEHDNLFDLDPLFSDPANGAYQLSTDSPAIDAGDPILLHDTFYDGDNDGTVRIDIGAFEYVPVERNAAPVVNVGDDQTIELEDNITVSATYSDVDNSEDHSARIDWGDGTIEDVPVTMTGPGAGEVTGQHTYSDIGNYTVKVCVVDIYGGVGCDPLSVEVLSTALYHFTGFFPPINNQPTLNTVKAGSAIPVKFSLDGYQGMNIFADGYPASGAVTCGSTTEEAIEPAVTAGSSTLSYHADADQYVYVWKTDKAWANTCRVLVVKLNDGSYYRASFKFK